MQVSRVTPQLHRFHDGGTPSEPPDRGAAPRIVLERLTERGAEEFRLERRIGYDDRELGELLVPADGAFRTDLTSVPWLFTWLVPKTGAHLPAALLHDGLVGGADGPASYVSTEGHVVHRDVADRVFRDAMADTGTGPVRRWLVWTAVATATIFVGSGGWSRARTWAHRVAAATTIAVVVVVGTLATVDLLDAGVALPWMGERPWWSELVGGAAGAVAIPFLLGLAWGRFRVAGAVLGVLLALLLHVTVALLLLTGLYQAVERLARASPTLGAVLGGSAVAAALMVFATYALF
ncbi:hypothetical protein GCM10009623_09770 [Nocardioides aestuarii]|uniref:DUF1353 domain-containing protein n=1 Tax=Nocardioides aestuarii TaxID=252231 RepID=A0ABW4TKG1_9ACTN